MDRRTEISDHFIHVGAGTSMALAWLGLIPGFIPVLALTAVVLVVLVFPLALLGLAAAVLAGPPYAGWRLLQRFRRRPGGPRRVPGTARRRGAHDEPRRSSRMTDPLGAPDASPRVGLSARC